MLLSGVARSATRTKRRASADARNQPSRLRNSLTRPSLGPFAIRGAGRPRTGTGYSSAMAPPDVFAPATLGPVRLRNRVVKAATFEGRTPDGQVTPELIDYHLAVTTGGVGLTTVAYLAVAPEGRTHAEQIVVGEDTLAGLRQADRRGPRDRRRGRRPGGPRRAGRQRPLQRCARHQRQPDAEPALDADDPRRDRAGPHPRHHGVRRRGTHAGPRGVRRARAAHGAQLPALQLPGAGAQPSHRTAGPGRWRTVPASRARSRAPYATRSGARWRSPRR